MRPLDVYIVEDHDEALRWMYRAMGGKRVAVQDAVLLHLDSHPDLLLPTALTAAEATSPAQLFERLSIGDWILPAVYAGHIGDVVWLRPPWARQLPEGELSCGIGLDQDGVLRIDSPQSYFISEQMHAPVAQLQNVRQFRIVVVTLDLASDEVAVAAQIARYIGEQSYLLDVDLDFFSTRDPFITLLPRADLHRRLRELFCLPVDPDTDVREAQQRRSELMEEARHIFIHLKTKGELDTYTGRATPLLASLKELAAEVRRCYTAEEVDWDLVHDAACTFDSQGLPHHVSEPEHIEEAVKQVGRLLAALPAPGAVTLARSSLDNYCPPHQVESIQQQVLQVLRHRYPSLAVQHKYEHG